MRLLLDESVRATLRRHLPGHDVQTAVQMGWSGVKNGKLLSLAALEFDAFITVDKNMPFQQNLGTLPIALVVLDAASNEVHALLPLLPILERELKSLKARSYVLVRAETCFSLLAAVGIGFLFLVTCDVWVRSCSATVNRLHIYKRPCCTFRYGPRYEPLNRAPFVPRGWARSPPHGVSRVHRLPV